MNQLAVSRRLAYVFGVLTPLAEVVRRWGTWWVNPPAFLDDFLIGGFLIAGAWATRAISPSSRARSVLAAAWGFACGMAYSSITYHRYAMQTGESDPAPIPTTWVFAIKLFGGLIFLAALLLTLTYRETPSTESPANPYIPGRR